MLIRPGTIQVRYHEPLETTGIDPQDREAVGALMERVRSAIQSGLDATGTAAES